MKVCLYCDRRFRKTEHLLRHQRSHTGEKPFACPHCDRRYGRSDVLLRHVKYMHDKMPPPANLKGTSSQKDLRKTPVVQNSPLDMRARAAPVSEDVPSPLADDIVPVDAPMSNPHLIQAEISPVLRSDKCFTTSMLLAHEDPEAEHSFPRDSNGAGLSEHVVLNSNPQQLSDRPVVPQIDHYHMHPMTDASLEGHLRPAAQERHADTADYEQISIMDQAHHNVSPHVRQMNDTFANLEPHLSTDIFSFLHGPGSSVSPHLEFLFPTVHCSPTALGSQPSSEERMSSVPAERFALVSRLWPRRWSSPGGAFTSHLWEGLVMPSRDTAASDILLPASLPVSMHGSQNMDCGLDDGRQQELMREFVCEPSASQRQSDSGLYAASHTGGSYDASSAPFDVDFPSTRLLNLGLFTAVRQTHCLVPFVHQPTFVVRTSPDSLLFSLCLLGFVMLDAEKTKGCLDKYLPIAIQKCCTQLAQSKFDPENSMRLVSDLSTATLLLFAVSLYPSQNDQETKMAQMLYHQTITVAQISGLFRPQSNLPPTAELLDQAQANIRLRSDGDGDGDIRWKIWARVESMKRLVAALLVTDSWWSYKLGTTPLVSIHAICYDMPCSTELFRSSSARSWERLISAGAEIDNQTLVLESHSPRTALASARHASPIGMMGLLSIFWIRITETRRRLVPQGPVEIEHGKRLIVPGAIYAKDESSKMLGHDLQDVYATYSQFLESENPDCVTLWHFLNLQLLVNAETFGIATGRYGVERAHSALHIIASWSKTHYARRACLHAAGIYKAMTRRRVTDGAMFHTEVSVFLAALVLGLYVFMVHSNDEDNYEAERSMSREDDVEPCEMLDDIEWPLLGLTGLVPLSETAAGDQRLDSSACRFIENESPLSFMGNVFDGGYDGARLIFIEYANLLGDLNKGTTEGLGQVLRIMSNSLVEMECANSPRRNS